MGLVYAAVAAVAFGSAGEVGWAAVIAALAILQLASATPQCGPLDLPASIARALHSSDEVAIRRAELYAADADLSLAKAAQWLPQATVTVIGGPAPDAHGNAVVYDVTENNRDFTELGPFVRFDASAIQPLWTWGQLSSARDAARAGVSARTLLVHDQQARVEVRVVDLYWGIALAHRLLDLAADVEKALEKADQTITEGLASNDGNVGVDDKYRVALFRGQLGVRKADAAKGLAMARAGLAATLALPEAALLLKEEQLPKGDTAALPSADEAHALAERQRPDLLALDQAAIAADKGTDAARGALFPQLFAAGTFSYAYAPNRDIQLDPWVYDYFNTLQAGVVLGLSQNLSFPIMLAKVDKARAQAEIVRRQRDGLGRLVQAEVDQALAEATAAQQKVAAANSALAAGKSWFRSMEENFGMGVASGRDLIDAYTGFIQSQVDMAQARYELAIARTHLDQTTGSLVSVAPREAPECTLP
jgi:outer membrane protein TolC